VYTSTGRYYNNITEKKNLADKITCMMMVNCCIVRQTTYLSDQNIRMCGPVHLLQGGFATSLTAGSCQKTASCDQLDSPYFKEALGHLVNRVVYCYLSRLSATLSSMRNGRTWQLLP